MNYVLTLLRIEPRPFCSSAKGVTIKLPWLDQGSELYSFKILCKILLGLSLPIYQESKPS